MSRIFYPLIAGKLQVNYFDLSNVLAPVLQRKEYD